MLTPRSVVKNHGEVAVHSGKARTSVAMEKTHMLFSSLNDEEMTRWGWGGDGCGTKFIFVCLGWFAGTVA